MLGSQSGVQGGAEVAPAQRAERRKVVVVGAGPTGLLLAGDLAAAGVDTLVLERRRTESNLTRAFAVHARTLELLDARGLADDLIAAGRPVGGLQLFGRVRIDLTRLPTRFPFVLVVPQYELERRLEVRARAAGAELRQGVDVIGLHQDEDTVTVVVRDPAGVVQELTADFVVGCDGAHSAVRHALGMPFPGRSAVRSVMLADVRLSVTPPDVLTVDAGPEGFAFIAPFGDGWYRVIAWDRANQRDDRDPVDLEDIRSILRRVLGVEYGLHDPRWMSRFHSDERQVPSYRVGRVFLAGDAAHVHSPAGGQGMNAGLQDAANLAWKLAAVATGRMPDGLLDTYQRERHPAGHEVVRMSSALLRLAMLRGPFSRRARDRVGAALTRFGPTGDRIAVKVSGLAVSYGHAVRGHRLVGTRIGDHEVRLADGTRRRLYEVLRDGHFVMLMPPEYWPQDVGAWQGIVVPAVSSDTDGACLLVRPDGYVASVVTDADPSDRATSMTKALTLWCGVPATSAGGAQRSVSSVRT
jgi:2-polyprenyl-6-methoxyphenol hydroxylase-like FAD-dependent oxidoreductase